MGIVPWELQIEGGGLGLVCVQFGFGFRWGGN